MRGCQSGTWSTGQKKVRGTSTKLQRQQNKYLVQQKQNKKRQKERNNNKIHMPEKDRRRAVDRESLVKCQPRAIRYPPRIAAMHPNAHHLPHSVLSGFQFSLTAQSTSHRESLGWSNQSGSKASQACYNQRRCNLNFVRLFCVSLLLPMFGRIFLFIHPPRTRP